MQTYENIKKRQWVLVWFSWLVQFFSYFIAGGKILSKLSLIEKPSQNSTSSFYAIFFLFFIFFNIKKSFKNFCHIVECFVVTFFIKMFNVHKLTTQKNRIFKEQYKNWMKVLKYKKIQFFFIPYKYISSFNVTYSLYKKNYSFCFSPFELQHRFSFWNLK